MTSGGIQEELGVVLPPDLDVGVAEDLEVHLLAVLTLAVHEVREGLFEDAKVVGRPVRLLECVPEAQVVVASSVAASVALVQARIADDADLLGAGRVIETREGRYREGVGRQNLIGAALS